MSIHWVFNAPARHLKGFDHDGKLVFECEARNDTVSEGYGHYGHCPPGTYGLGAPMRLDPPEVPYGGWYVPVNDIHGLWERYGREGIGVHGGGSGLPEPFAERQGWQITEGCVRLQNEDLARFVTLVTPSDIFSVFWGPAT